MRLHRTPLIAAGTAGLLAGALLGAPVAFAAPPVPGAGAPTLVALCAATSIDEVDELLADVAATDLVDALAPLATLTVPQGTDDLVLDADVTLGDVREALGCTVDPDPTDPTTAPTTPGADGQDDDTDTSSGVVDPGADDGSVADTSGEQVLVVPDGSVDTGGR